MNAKPLPTMTTADCARFWSKVDRSDECWEWTAARLRGYGKFAIGGRRTGRVVPAHRVAWFLARGADAALHLDIDHLCRNRGCVNPDHLRLVTHAVNVRASHRWGAPREAA